VDAQDLAVKVGQAVRVDPGAVVSLEDRADLEAAASQAGRADLAVVASQVDRAAE